jgi:adenine-specific DNA methylase
MLDYSKSFIEEQFPVSKISKESYKERKAGASQTLTGLGKWWGRKPLILVRAALLGVLMPTSDNPKKDKEIFLKILTMDEEGLWLRKSKNISKKDLWRLTTKEERNKYFSDDSTDKKPKYPTGISSVDKEDLKEELQRLVFNRLSYDDKLKYCDRPEHVELKYKDQWEKINNHLKTKAYSLQELVHQLGEIKFGENPKVGDCFSGGGSIPFEAARIGADVFASDLNPIACLLTWASLNVSDQYIKKEIIKFQNEVYKKVNDIVKNWGIENNEKDHRADAYLYCNETVCPECGYKVPIAPSWIIGKGTKTVAILEDNNEQSFDIKIKMNANKNLIKEAEEKVTIKNNNLYCPHCEKETPISSIRRDRKDENGKNVYGLRKWGKREFVPREDDVFQERLYAIRYVDENGDRYYTEPSKDDLKREEKVVQLLSERFIEWQNNGYIPSLKIEKGYNTDQPIRERGWQYWHQLFNARQLLKSGLFNYEISKYDKKALITFGLLGLNKFFYYDSKLCIWDSGGEKGQQTFYNQALNTPYNYVSRSLELNKKSWFQDPIISDANSKIEVKDARIIEDRNNIWITDPPYADAVNYHELSEFFLSWDKKLLKKAFPEWYTDSKRVLAVKGTGKSFNESMIEIYKNLADHMPDNGYQVVMFTHQDVKVWSELAMILWASGLRVVSAWNISTETESGGLKTGNYVKGTVLLTLKKQTSEDMAFQDELYSEIKRDVKRIIDSMKEIDDKDDPDFSDADYLLASYAASLKVITSYGKIDGIDLDYWLAQPRDSELENPVETLINKAVRVAYDYLIPEGIDKSIWRDLKPEERFYIRGLELEMNGENRISSFQELARGFGVKDYADMFANLRANSARLKTPSEYAMRYLNGNGFSNTPLRHVLVAINETTKSKSTVEGRAYLKDKYQKDNEYWYKKPLMAELLDFISTIEFVESMDHWKEHAYSAKLLREALKNEGV